MSAKQTPDESTDVVAPDRVSGDPLARSVVTLGRAVAIVAAVAVIWTVAQFWIAREDEDVAGLWLPASIVYAAGLGYLALTAAVALRARSPAATESAQSAIGSLALTVAHAIVLTAVVMMAWRGVAARGLLVGLGSALVAWGVIALLAMSLEIANWIARGSAANAPSHASLASPGARLASACLACAVAIGLSLAYLESHPLPNSQSDRPTESESQSDDEGVARQESPSKGNEEG